MSERSRLLFNTLWWLAQAFIWMVIALSSFGAHGIITNRYYEVLFPYLIVQAFVHAMLLRKYFPRRLSNWIMVITMPFLIFIGIFIIRFVVLIVLAGLAGPG